MRFLFILTNEFNSLGLSPAPGPSDTDCLDDEISCDGECHPLSIRCNGVDDCSDGIDEENCGDDRETESPISSSTRAPFV